MYLKKVADYKTQIYGDEQIEKEALLGAVAGLFKAFAPKLAPIGEKALGYGKGALGKAKESYDSFSRAGIAGKAARGAGLGAGLGAIKGSFSYDSANDNGDFGNSRLGLVAKGALGGAAIGAAAGGIAGVAQKGLRSMSEVPAAPPPVAPPHGSGAVTVPNPAHTLRTNAKPNTLRTNAKSHPTSNLAKAKPGSSGSGPDGLEYKAAEYIDLLYMEKISNTDEGCLNA